MLRVFLPTPFSYEITLQTPLYKTNENTILFQDLRPQKHHLIFSGAHIAQGHIGRCVPGARIEYRSGALRGFMD